MFCTKVMFRNTKAFVHGFPPGCYSLRPKPVGIGIYGSFSLDLVLHWEPMCSSGAVGRWEESPRRPLGCQFNHCDLLRACIWRKVPKKTIRQGKSERGIVYQECQRSSVLFFINILAVSAHLQYVHHTRIWS